MELQEARISAERTMVQMMELTNEVNTKQDEVTYVASARYAVIFCTKFIAPSPLRIFTRQHSSKRQEQLKPLGTKLGFAF